MNNEKENSSDKDKNPKEGNHSLKYAIVVSGAARTDHCADDALKNAERIGKEIVKHNGVVITGATSGAPFWAAKGAKEAGGLSIGLSPAVSQQEHVKTYHLPIDYFDFIMYTGFNYSGRNLLLVRSSDATITVCGCMGTLNEFTAAFEDEKPIGVLTESGGTADMVKEIVEKSHRGPGKIVYDSDPKKLVEKVIDLIDEEKVVDIDSENIYKV